MELKVVSSKIDIDKYFMIILDGIERLYNNV